MIRALIVFTLFTGTVFAQTPKSPGAQSPKSSVTEISADLGPCTAEFHVTNLAGDPLYNAQITTIIRYGFMSKHKLELDTGTNADGLARFVRLPAQVKQPLEFRVRYQEQSASLSVDPGTDCTAQRTVPLAVGKGK